MKKTIILGNFDGVHKGHQQIIKQAIEIANKNNETTLLITFDKSYQELTHPEQFIKQQITTNQEKKAKILNLGIDEVEILEFSKIKDLTYQDFEKLLIEKKASNVVVGYDYFYGKERQGSVNTLKQNSNFNTTVIEQINIDNEKISSTNIRQYILNGEFEKANDLLGYNYTTTEKVVPGKQLGRTIGFPTANLEQNCQKANPNPGVYVAYTYLNGKKYHSVVSIGTNPTVSSSNNEVIEVHILDFKQDIYGENITIEWLAKIRNTLKLNGLEELIQKIKEDVEYTKNYFKKLEKGI